MSKLLVKWAELWAYFNDLICRVFLNISWDVEIKGQLDYRSNYLVLANHQSWADILVLQTIVNRRIPFLRFFIKRELMYVPFLNLAWWALDFPFLRRYSAAQLRNEPSLMGKDLEIAKKSCEKFKKLPASILIFAEGTRFSEKRKKILKTPLNHLLPAKSGGISIALDSMGSLFKSILDITIVYPQMNPSFWNYVKGVVSPVIVRVRELEVPDTLLSSNETKTSSLHPLRKKWINDIWAEKDNIIDQLLSSQFGQKL